MTEQSEAAGSGDAFPAADGSPTQFSDPDPRWSEDFTGLLHLGYLTCTFEYLGHKVLMRTLKTDEELIVAEIVAPWSSTIGGTKAYATALAALAVVTIDGQPMPTPLGETGGGIQWAQERFNYARRWYPFTIDHFYSRYMELEARVTQILDGLGKGSPQEGVTPGSSASAGSPTGGDFSLAPPSP